MIDLFKEPKRHARVHRDSRWSVLTGLAALFSMTVLMLGVYLLVRYLFGMNALSLYLKYGYYISLSFTFVTLILDLDQERDLISTHPFHYASACLRLMRGPLQAVGADFKRDADQHASHPLDTGPIDSTAWGVVSRLAQSLMHVFDLFISGFFSIVFIILVAAWLFFLAPAQYFIFLICGAPARIIERSQKKSHDALHQAEMNILDMPASEVAPAAMVGRGEAVSSSWKPVRMTSALTLLVLWILSRLLY